MFKKLIFIFTYLVSTLASICFTKESNKLFTYKEKVCDSIWYKHPGGQNDITKLVGHDLYDFVNSNSD